MTMRQANRVICVAYFTRGIGGEVNDRVSN